MLGKFVKRLQKIGIETTYTGNYPWVYLDTINGKRVAEKFQANHGFTAFMQTNKEFNITDRREVFKLIRKYIKA